MLDTRSFWIANILGLLAVYAGGLWCLWQGQTSHWLVLLSLVILFFHLLEIPLAFRRLRSLNPQPLRVAVMTLVFGLLWWVPAGRGLFSVR